MLDLPDSEQIVLLERLRYLRGEPLVVTTAYMPYALCAPILELDMSDRSLFETYERELGYRLHRGTRAIEARAASAEIAEHLGVREGAPVLAFSGVTYIEDGRAIEYFVGIHRGDRSRFETELFGLRRRPRRGPALRAGRDVIELGLIGSAWHGTGLTVVEGIRKTKELGFDTYDVFEDPLMISGEAQRAIKDTCAEVGLPTVGRLHRARARRLRSAVRRFTLDRCRAYIDQQVFLGGRNVLLVAGEYYCDLQVGTRPTRSSGSSSRTSVSSPRYAEPRGIELVIELEPFENAIAGSVPRA